MPRVEAVDTFEAFARTAESRDAESLGYKNLDESAWVARQGESYVFCEFLDAPEGTFEEDERARTAAVNNLVLTSLQLQRSRHVTDEARARRQQESLSDRFTEASIELYGAPEPGDVAALAAQELRTYSAYIGRPDIDQQRVERLVGFYSAQVGERNPVIVEKLDPEIVAVLDGMQQYLQERYAPVFEVFDNAVAHHEIISAKAAAKLFRRAIRRLAETDPMWDSLRVEVGKAAATEYSRKKNVIKMSYGDRETASLKGLFAHEVLVHAQGALNGKKAGDPSVKSIVPGFIDAEEGKATFLQKAVGGNRKPPASGLYMNIGFALGQLNQPPVTRAELAQKHLDALVVKRQAAGKAVDIDDLSRRAWSHVNRIYKGSLGNDIIAVNTHDIAYYKGFYKIAPYAVAQRKAGKSIGEIYEELTALSLDPTDDLQASKIYSTK